MPKALDTLIDALRAELGHLANGLVGGQLQPAEWHNATLQALADYHAAAYLAGRGLEMLDADGETLVLAQIADQAGYLNRFTDAVEANDLSVAQIAVRAGIYAASLRTTWSRAATWGANLPFYPGDGGTACLMYCGCSWQSRGGGWWWMLGATHEHCDDCRVRADGSPYEG